LKDWLVRNRKFNSWLAATEENHKNRASLRGVTLSEAKTYYSERPDDIDTDVQTYIRSHLRRRRWFRITVAMVVVLAITASAVTIFSAVTAFRLRDLDIARGVVGAAQNLRSGNPALAAQLSLAAYRLGPDDSVTGNLLDTFASPYAVRLTQHTDIVETVAVHRGLLATGGWDSRVRLWDIGDPHRPGLLDTVEVPNGGAWSVAFSPDGQTLAVASADRTIHLVDISDPRHVRTRLQLVGHTDQVTTLAYGPAGGSRLLLATSGADRTVRLWDLHAPDRALAELTDHQDHVRSVAISPDGRTLASAGLDGTVRRWDITDPTAPARLPLLRHSGSVYSVSFSPKGPLMATAGVDGIRLWDITDPSAAVALSTVGQLTEPVSATVFDAAGTTLASANWDDKAYLWDITDPKNIKEQYRYTGHEDNVTSVAFASTGRTLITGDIDKTVRLWDLPPPALKVHGDVYSTDLDRTGRLLATGSGDWKARLWDVRSPYRPLATLDGHTHNVDAVVFAPRGAVLLTASFDGTAILWDIKNPRHPRRLSTLAGGHTDGIVTAAFTPDGATVATGSRDGTVRLWDVRDPVHPEKLERVGGNGGYVTMLTISGGPNGAFVAAVLTLDGAVRLWNITDPNAPVAWESLPSHDKDAWALAVSRDGRLLATASFDRTVRLWDISDPQRPRRLGTYVHNTHQFLTVAFSPDGRTLATGDLGRFVDLLDISNTGQLTIGTELDDGHT
jgi:WD40 repeat protein